MLPNLITKSPEFRPKRPEKLPIWKSAGVETARLLESGPEWGDWEPEGCCDAGAEIAPEVADLGPGGGAGGPAGGSTGAVGGSFSEFQVFSFPESNGMDSSSPHRHRCAKLRLKFQLTIKRSPR
jgi:hypothetical protein